MKSTYPPRTPAPASPPAPSRQEEVYYSPDSLQDDLPAFFKEDVEAVGPSGFYSPEPLKDDVFYNKPARGAPAPPKKEIFPKKRFEAKKSSFKPPTLIERFNTPVVEPSLPFQPLAATSYTAEVQT